MKRNKVVVRRGNQIKSFRFQYRFQLEQAISDLVAGGWDVVKVERA